MLGSTVGALSGALIPILLEPVIASKFPIPIIFGFYYEPILNAIFYGILTAILFSIWPLGRMLNNTVTSLIRNFISQTKILPNPTLIKYSIYMESLTLYQNVFITKDV